MYLKRRLMKAASICSYVFTGLWLIAAACCFAFSNGLYWLFLIFGLACLYNGFVITSISESMTEVSLEKSAQSKFLACWIVSILCLPAFILNGIAYFRRTEDELAVVRQDRKPAGSGGEVCLHRKPAAPQDEGLYRHVRCPCHRVPQRLFRNVR